MMKEKIRSGTLAVLALAFTLLPLAAGAVTWVTVGDLSLLKYQTAPDGRVYVRNLNEFNGSALGCCYNYYVDTNTVEGKNIFALILFKAAQGKGLYLGVADQFAPGAITYVGEF